MIDIKKLYDNRFTSLERVRKVRLWKILCENFLQKYIDDSDTVVDVGAGHCEFINNINCRSKIAVDLNNGVKSFAGRDVKVIISSVKHLRKVFPNNSINVIFMSNLLEHLDSKEDVFRLLREAYEILKPGGKLLIMQPDIKLVGNEYWDFFDHKVAITFASLTEALLANKYKISSSKYPFLPYSTKVRFMPTSPLLLKLYLRLRPLHFIFGKQFFICAVK